VRIILSELREEFWILRARQAIKKVLQRCLPCKMAKAHHGHQIEAPLPADRVIPQKPFGVTGIDFAGSFYIKARSNIRKGYIALFTCATTRVVHLILCTDMSNDKFFLALQRFVVRLRLSHSVYTDNAQTLTYHQQKPRSTMVLSICSQKSPIHRSSQLQLEVYCSEGNLVGRMVGDDDRDHETLST